MEEQHTDETVNQQDTPPPEDNMTAPEPRPDVNKTRRWFIIPIIISLAAGILIGAAMTVLYLCSAPQNALITDTDGKMYRARLAMVTGRHSIILSRGELFSDRKQAINSAMSDTRGFIDINSVRLIEFLPEVIEEEEPVVEPAPAAHPKAFTGSVIGAYAVNVSGHRGTMIISRSNGVLTGTIQFPQWAKGQIEYLRKVRISGNIITFTRSVEDEKERRRIGAPTFFVQNFSGEITGGGKFMKGQFTNHGAKEMWEAEKK
ncbi:MAG TPA: hypothetical protein PKK43_01840 [Spirochaetota bacterium]|nr:hypothetical protein [Spirochaetota bacterium]